MYVMDNFKGLITALLSLAFTVPNANYLVDSFAISCGSSSRMIAADGRAWLEDIGSAASSFHTLSGKSTMTTALHHDATVIDPTPYDKARISHHEFTYTFHVPPGQKFIRLHFYRAAYKGFQNSVPKFSVKAGKFTLLTNFSPALHAQKTIVKEFCVNIKENQALDIVFSPFLQAKSKDVYAFINGIEIVSMPAGLYFTGDSDLGAEVVGQKYNFYIDNATALELVKRLNIGGNSIPSVEDESMFRGWDSDFDSFTHTDSVSINRNVKIQYKAGPSSSYIAPMRVYQSAKTTRPENQLNKHNLIWKISVDSGFRYLIRLHFCELEPAMAKDGERKFSIFINNAIAESNADIIKWGEGHGVALYRDFVVILEGNNNRGKYNLLITLKPKLMSNHKQSDAILNGLEIFKMSNPDNQLASRSDVHHIQSPKSTWSLNHMRSPFFGSKNAIATTLIVIITSLNIVVHYLRRLSERSSDVSNMSSEYHEFSLDEIRSATNNLQQENLISSVGSGNVYNGKVSSNRGPVVASQQFKSESRQGENEFGTEIQNQTKLQYENIVSMLVYCNERSSDVRNMSSQCHQFTLDEIRSATNNFHQDYLIGSGGYGKVYKGRVSSNGGIMVAIKRLKPESTQGENEFWTEIEMLTKLHHENLVLLVGYCDEKEEMLLIYQYMKRGTLDDHLYKIAAKGIFHPPLSWDQRLKIAIGAASGLWYLHEKQVIHRDVKSSNILIDENWVAKISDFGLSRMGPLDESLFSHVSTDVKGTFGYLCPEYFHTRMLSFKSDVYAFGVVLLEVLTGRKPVDLRLPAAQYSLAIWAQNCIRNGNVDAIIDPTLYGHIEPSCLKKFVEIAQSCLKRVPRERPSMFDVVRDLNSALELQQGPDPEDVTEVGEIYNDDNNSFEEILNMQVKDVIASIEARRKMIEALVPYFGRPLEADSATCGKATFLACSARFTFIVYFSLPIQFPKKQPNIVLQSSQHFDNGVPIKSQVINEYPWNPRWDSFQMAERLFNFLAEECLTFKKYCYDAARIRL